MKTLSGLDASFLYLECAEMPMHVGSLHLYELPSGFTGSFHQAVQRHVAARLHLAPLFRQQLTTMPLNVGHPSWVQAERVDLDFHVRKAASKKLSRHEVEAICADLHGQLLDRSRPLWEFHIFDHVAAPRGKRYGAFYSKIHHAALDGKAGTVLANALLDLSATPREVPPPAATSKHRQHKQLSAAAMVSQVLTGSFSQYAKLARSLPAAISAAGGTLLQRLRHPSKESASPPFLAPLMRFNVAVTPQRSFATATVPFAPCRAIAKAQGISFNDLLLWLCATALRQYLLQHDGVPKKSLVAAMPVSLREDQNLELNTQASMTLVQLGTQYADPKKRLQAILASSGKVKDALLKLKGILPTDYPSLLAPWLVGGIGKALFKTYSATGLSARLPMPSNLVISNVPGPQVPLYLAGARMLTFHPLSIVMHGVALNITVQTYAGSVDFGLIADAHAVPTAHLQSIAGALGQAFAQAQELFSDAAPQPESTPSPQEVKPKRKRSKSVAGGTQAQD